MATPAFEYFGFGSNLLCFRRHRENTTTNDRSFVRVNQLYSFIDFSDIFVTSVSTESVRELVQHFKPSLILLQSTFTAALPNDILSAFTNVSPRSMVIQFNGFRQQIIANSFQLHDLHIGNFVYDKCSSACNSILSSVRELKSLEINRGVIDDNTATFIVQQNLEKLTLSEVDLQIRNPILLLEYMRTNVHLKTLKMHYLEGLSPESKYIISAVLQRIHVMHLISLEVSLETNYLSISNIKHSTTLRHVRLNIVSYLPNKLFQYIFLIINECAHIHFQIHFYHRNFPQNHHLAFESLFKSLPNVDIL